MSRFRSLVPLAVVGVVGLAGLAGPASGSPLVTTSTNEDVVQLVRVSTPTLDGKDRLTGLGLDLTEHAGADFVEVVLHDAADVATLTAAGFDYEVEIPDLALRTAQNNQAGREYAE